MGDPDIETLVKTFLCNGPNGWKQFVKEVSYYFPNLIPSGMAAELKRHALIGELAAAEAKARKIREQLQNG